MKGRFIVSKTQMRVLPVDTEVIDFTPSGYAYPERGDKITARAYVDIAVGRNTITLEVEDIPAFVATLSKAADKAQALATKEAERYTALVNKSKAAE